MATAFWKRPPREQTLVAAHDGVEAIVLDTGSNGINGWEILPQLRRIDPGSAHSGRSVEPGYQQNGLLRCSANGRGRQANEEAQIGEMVRVLGARTRESRILVVEKRCGPGADDWAKFILGEMQS